MLVNDKVVNYINDIIKQNNMNDLSNKILNIYKNMITGIPVQWKPNPHNTLCPVILLYLAANSLLVIENACPKCSLPFCK